MKDVKYYYWYDVYKDTTIIKIIYDGACIFSLEFIGQMQPPAIKEYAKEAIELMKEKGAIK